MNLVTKISTVAGLAAGIIYVIVALAATYRTATVPSLGELALQVVVFTVFCAPFGAAIGLGFGLLLSSCLRKGRKSD